jgi:CRP/FNR family transcriptional regulator
VPQAVPHSCAHASDAVLAAGLQSRCESCRVRMLSICAALDLDEVAELEEASSSACLNPRATLFQQDEPARHVFNVTHGTVRLSKLLPDGRRQIVGFAMAGDFLGLALADRHGFTAEAVDHVVACKFPRQDFVDLVDAKPHLMKRLHSFTAHELSLAQDQMVVLGKRNAEEKIATFLVQLRNRIARLEPVTVHVSLPMSRQDIADYVGLTLETVSRTFSKLVKSRDIVIVPDGVRLLNTARMENLAAG